MWRHGAAAGRERREPQGCRGRERAWTHPPGSRRAVVGTSSVCMIKQRDVELIRRTGRPRTGSCHLPPKWGPGWQPRLRTGGHGLRESDDASTQWLGEDGEHAASDQCQHRLTQDGCGARRRVLVSRRMRPRGWPRAQRQQWQCASSGSGCWRRLSRSCRAAAGYRASPTPRGTCWAWAGASGCRPASLERPQGLGVVGL
jgi:hypothetical protein